jgi:hypothetical protein
MRLRPASGAGWLLLAAALAAPVAAEPAAEPAAPAAAGAAWFVDVTREVGLDGRHEPHLTGLLHLPEIMGPGLALADLDDDGHLDVYLVQGSPLDRDSGAPTSAPLADRVWRGEPAGTGPGLRFTEVTSRWLPRPSAGYGVGVASGDFDGDGRLDLFLPRYGADLLLRGVGDGRLVDVTARAGPVSNPGWSVAASPGDFDADGHLDLYVVDYLRYLPVRCVLPSGRPDWCGPRSFAPAPDRVLRGLGDGRFVDATASWLGTAPRLGPGLGAVVFDSNDDGWLDLYVANDGAENDLWRNRAGRGFAEEGLLAGVALNRRGQPEASMGLVAADLDGDGDEDLFATHLTGESNTLWQRFAPGVFEDRTAESGLGPPSLPWTAFGVVAADFDLDGDLDLVTVSGAVHLPDRPLASEQQLAALAQYGQLFVNDGRGRFREAPEAAGEALQTPRVGRGLAVGDLDNDGDPDLVYAELGGPARVLLNRVGDGKPWVGLRVLEGRRDALGATVVLRQGALRQVRRVRTDGSYASASDPRILFAWPDPAAGEVVVEVRWPDGRSERFASPAPGRYTVLRRGEGTPLP